MIISKGIAMRIVRSGSELELTHILGASDTCYFSFWKGRVALYAILKSLGIEAGDEVILPGFTCVVVPNAILYLGAKPIYTDINPQTYNICAETIAPWITPRTRAIIVQNTFGLSPDLDPIMELTERKGIFVVEDCAHGLGGSYKERPAGTTAHASFFSTQWSKPISIGLGGIAYVRDEELISKVTEISMKFPAPGKKEELVLALQRLLRPLADHPALYYGLVDLYRFLTQKSGLSVGSSSGSELDTIQMPEGYLKSMGKMQRRSLRRELAMLEEKVQHRREVAAHYDAFFSKKGMAVPFQPDYAYHSMLRYPVRVPNKDAFLEKAHQLHIPVGDWFLSPLHPIRGDLSQWGYQRGQCPEAEKACAEVINLFTDHPLSYQQLSSLFPG